jgi:hypothetical protein
MSGVRRFWRSLAPVLKMPLIDQPFLILAHLSSALLWVLVVGAACLGRLLAVVAGEAAFIGGIVLCLLGLGYIGAPLGVAGLVASRLAA